MTTARYYVGDVHEQLARIDPESVELVLCSPPFLALRSYLPDGHPAKAQEIGSERTPGEFIQVLLEWTAAAGRVLAPHGSFVVELGDTYSGSGGSGGDYATLGLRAQQPGFDGSARRRAAGGSGLDKTCVGNVGGDGWPRDKSLAGIPQAYQLSLAYGRNVLTGEPSPAGRWIIRNVKPWIRSNPPVGALGDKERPATSYVIVATRASDRYFDLDAVRGPGSPATNARTALGVAARPNNHKSADDARTGGNRSTLAVIHDTAGAPPRDWWHHVDAILDAELDRLAGKTYTRDDVGPKRRTTQQGGEMGPYEGGGPAGARGVHLRRALERAGILATVDALDVSPKGYAGAHYAVWPPELVRLLLAEMCPARVCTTCGQPSRRLVDTGPTLGRARTNGSTTRAEGTGDQRVKFRPPDHATSRTVGWSDCGHGTWRPGRVLDPFAGSGTTLAVASGMGFDSIGIDIDYRNAGLALERVGMWLDVWWPDNPDTFAALPAGNPQRAAYRPWLHLYHSTARHMVGLLVDLLHGARHDTPSDPTPAPRRARTVPVLAGQTDLFTPQETPT